MGNNSPKSGVILKSKLGLDSCKYVLLARCLATSSMRTYMIFFDSRNPNTPLSTGYILRTPMASMIYTNPFEHKPAIIAPMPIEEYNGDLNAVFFVIDIAGIFANDNIRTRVIESKLNEFEYFKYPTQKEIDANTDLNESLSFSDLKQNAVSDLNKKFLAQRKKEGNSGSKLQSVTWNESNDTIGIVFFVNPTYDKEVKNYSPTGSEYIDNKYTVEIEFQNVSNYLGDRETFNSFTPKEQGDLILSFLDNCEVKLWSSDPSWIFQGSFEAMDDLDASIFPLWSPKGKDIWNARHGLEPHITKHTYEIAQVLKANYQDIARQLRGEIKEEFVNYFKSPYRQDEDSAPIFKNPSMTELKEIQSYKEEGWIRAIIFLGKDDIYTSDGYLLHNYILEGLKEKGINENFPEFIQIDFKNKFITNCSKKGKQEDIFNITWIQMYCHNFKLEEQFSTGAKSNDIYYEVYKNPTQTELNEILSYHDHKMLRGVINDNETYVSDYNLLHGFIIQEAKLRNGKENICFIVDERKGKIYIGDTSSEIGEGYCASIISNNPWIKEHFKNFDIYDNEAIENLMKVK